MDPVPNPPNDDRDERLAALLRSATGGAPPPDGEFLARLREQSAAAFAAPPASPPTKLKGRAMFPRLLAAIAATAAAIAIIIAVFTTKPETPVTPDEKKDGAMPTLAKALEDTAGASTLRYKVTAGGQTREIMAEKAGRWREELAGGTALVSDGEMIWRVDTQGKTSRANAVPLSRNLFETVLAGQKHNPVDLAKQVPAGMEKVGDEQFVVYKVDVADGVNVEAKVSEKTNQVRSLTARAAGKVIAELEVTAVNDALPEDKFLILNSLSEDGRIGKIIDTQGVVAVKPLAQGRWTPVGGDFVVMPGDWLRTDARGGNVAAMKLLSRASLIVGPGSVVEVAKSTQLKLIEGELEITVPKGASVELLGPEDQKVIVKEKQHYYLDRDQKLRLAGKEPPWLKGFKGATANESIGSLVAKVDGRSEPLSVGYHKVSVDIRDQIARTTIEESFVNHTDVQLEGVFTFPLPQDASIAEFGMWIGNELVMADVVEKQRARDIYEQIKRERRDPGLLEWSGGNLFTARVWPIFAHSEKRIKITYTQVLPLRGNKYAYSYALQSDMLQLHPLRELSLTVNVNSAVPLKKVFSPTHSTRDQATPNAARVEFTAQEYTPRKDFEVVVEQDKRPSDVVLVPHRRGNDGYFLLQVMPPAQNLDRATLPDAGPMRLLIIADTSSSMDRKQRQQQEAFIASLVSALTPQDTFNLACCDVTCDWAFENPVPADGKNLIAAREMLFKRRSLGWSDLNKAFDAAMTVADARTQVVYVGDAIPVTTRTDPVEFAKHLKEKFAGRGTFHAVTTGSTFEPQVAKAIASLGGGSWRRIGAEQGPTAVALELLREMTQPTLRDVKVEFTGLRTARVYPAELPNVPAGTQQILLGRYLADGRDQEGEVVVSGTLDGKPVRMATRVSLKDAESGNSFIPRLWARMHLDALLDLGSSESIKDEVIALSEEYNILTPYTSFLVLETDADRERFGVKKRFRMRDGEKFFAEGRDNVDFALVQQQMKRAGLWRQNLRRDVLRSFANLGRALPSRQREYAERAQLGKLFMMQDREETYSRVRGGVDVDGTEYFNLGDAGGAPGSFGGGSAMPSSSTGMAPQGNEPLDQLDSPKSGEERDEKALKDSRDYEGKATEGGRPNLYDMDESVRADDLAPGAGPGGPAVATSPAPAMPFPAGEQALEKQMPIMDAFARDDLGLVEGLMAEPRANKPGGMLRSKSRISYGDNDNSIYWQRQWWGELFPALPPAVKPLPPRASNWPEQARKLAQGLLRRDHLRRLKGGLEFTYTEQALDGRFKEVTSERHGVELISPIAWLARYQPDGAQTTINWSTEQERGRIHQAFGIGRIRNAKPEDLEHAPPIHDYSLTALDEVYRDYAATVEAVGDDRVRLIIKAQNNEFRALIDTAKPALLELEQKQYGKVVQITKFADFVEAAGGWWARKVESINHLGQTTGVTTYTVRALSVDDFASRMKAELAGREQVLFIKAPSPKLADARKAISANKASVEDHAALMLHFASIQQWTKAREQLELLEKLTDKPAKRWLRDAILHLSRRFDELRQRHLDEAGKLPESKLAPNDAYAIAQHLYNRSSNFMQSAEMLPLVEKMRPVYERQPKHVYAMKEYTRNRLYQLQNLGRIAESRELLKGLATQYPRDESLQREYAQALFNDGDYPSGYAWIEKALAANPVWQEHEEESLRNLTVQYLTQQGRAEDLFLYVGKWMAKKPASRTPYSIHLATLIRLGREEEANTAIAKWLKDGQVRGEMKPEAAGRLTAAIYQAIGQGHGMATWRVEERWVPELVEVVRFFAHDEQHGQYADLAMPQLQQNGSDAVKKLRTELARELLAGAAEFAPHRIDRLANWVSAHDEPGYWKKLTEVLRKRWQDGPDKSLKYALANSLLYILRQHDTADAVIAFMRLQLEAAEAREKPMYARQLFDTLIGQPWKQEYEDEAFALLVAIGGEDAARAARSRVEALHGLTDAMIAQRHAALNQKIDRPDKLTRTELRDKQAANLKQARTEFADRLTKKTPRAPKDLTQWIRMERLYFDVILERNLPQVETDCWEILGSDPPKPVDPEAEPSPSAALDGLLKQRAFVTLNYLATRRKAEAASVEKLLTYIDKGIAQEGEGSAWKAAKHRLLVVADRPKDLEKDMRQWVEKSPEPNTWRLHLGFLLAELGRLKEAVPLFETIHATGELGPHGYRSLADWYMVLNQKDKHEEALFNQYRFTPEQHLSQMIYQKLYPWQRGGGHLPSELDKDVLRMFAVLFEKSAQPGNYVNQLAQFYQACRDFRLLAVLADAVVGQTPVKVYPFLQQMGYAFNQIQDEAVVDELMEQLARSRQKAKTTVDQRALDLVEVLVRRRAAELKNQPAPHGDAALTAMKRAFDRAWVDGEQPLMAQLLHGLGSIAYQPLADEQMRESKWLYEQQKKASYDRLRVGHYYAILLGYYGRFPAAIDVLTAELADYLAAAGNGILPPAANQMVATLIGDYQQTMEHAKAETYLQARLQKPGNDEQRVWYNEQLNGLYQDAFTRNGAVSLGQGTGIYPAFEKKLRKDTAEPNPYHQYRMVVQACQLYTTAKDRTVGAYADDLRSYGNKLLPEVVKFHHGYYDSTMTHVAQTIRNLIGPVDAIEFVLNRIEKEPTWFRLNNQDGWARHGGSLAYWRNEARGIGTLEPRLLAVTLRELRRDLEERNGRNRSMYYKTHGYYWSEKEPDFVKVAEEVYAKRSDSAAHVIHLADYFYHGVGRPPRAIEILYAAHAKQMLDENGIATLVTYLREQQRHAEAITLLEPLVAKTPGNITYRVWLMNSYHRAGRPEKLRAQLKDSHAYFHAENRWNEHFCATLAYSTLENDLWAESAEYYKECIPLHQRSAPNRGIGDGVLAEYYSNLARAYSRLGKTDDAVDAASGAIVAWPIRHQSRQHYLDRLREVLAEATDLNAFVTRLDQRDKESGQGSPVVRKAVAKAYQSRGQFAQAIPQYKAAIELQPEDFESHDQLVACYDQLGDKEGAIAATLEAVNLARRNLALYKKLGDRMAALQRHHDAERAFTSLVEMQPLEPESHTLLAQVRQSQSRLDDAAAHWEQAAKFTTLEPTAYIELARVQLALKQLDKADATITKLEKTSWPARFDPQRQSIQQLRAEWKTQKR